MVGKLSRFLIMLTENVTNIRLAKTESMRMIIAITKMVLLNVATQESLQTLKLKKMVIYYDTQTIKRRNSVVNV